ncbi:MAG TPA: hypothetical protein VIK10_11060 [Prolixibacteraceae bacterium]
MPNLIKSGYLSSFRNCFTAVIVNSRFSSSGRPATMRIIDLNEVSASTHLLGNFGTVFKLLTSIQLIGSPKKLSILRRVRVLGL